MFQLGLFKLVWGSGYASCTIFLYDTSTSNTRVAPPGILGGLPVEPYAYSDLIVKTDNSPRVIEATPRSHPISTTYDKNCFRLKLYYNYF